MIAVVEWVSFNIDYVDSKSNLNSFLFDGLNNSIIQNTIDSKEYQ